MWAGAEIKISLPKPGESAAVSDMPKLAALCYDRIHGYDDENKTSEYYVPDPIRFSGATETELQIDAMTNYGEVINNWIKSELLHGDIKDSVKRLKKEVPRKAAVHALRLITESYCKKLNVDEFFKLIQKKMAKEFTIAYEIPVVPIFQSGGISDFLYFGGEREAVYMSLVNLQIPDEKNLEWSQVLEFRKDTEAKKKYRKLLYWLDKEMIGKSQSFVEESIAIKLEEYEQALKKHGFKTIIATIEQALDGRIITGATSVAGSLALSGYPVLGILAGTGLIVGKTAVQLAKAKISFNDIEVGLNSEISWIYKLKQF